MANIKNSHRGVSGAQPQMDISSEAEQSFETTRGSFFPLLDALLQQIENRYVDAPLSTPTGVLSPTATSMTPSDEVPTASDNPSQFSLLEELIDAAIEGRKEDVMRMLDEGIDINQYDKTFGTPLHAAALNGHADVVSLLLARGASVNARNHNERTPLHVASWNDRSGRCVSLLIGAGADLHAKDCYGKTPLHSAAEDGNVTAVREIIAAGGDIHCKDNAGETPLLCAAINGKEKVLRELVNAGADINCRGNVGNTALHYASRSGREGAVEALIEGGVDVHSGNEAGEAPLHLAARSGNEKVILALIAAGASKIEPNVINQVRQRNDMVIPRLMWLLLLLCSEIKLHGTQANRRRDIMHTVGIWIVHGKGKKLV